MTGPRIPIAKWVDETKYRQEGEEFNQKCSRVAGALSDYKEHYDMAYDILKDQRFLPGGRVQSAVGSVRQTTAFNCLRGDTEIITSSGLMTLEEAYKFGKVTLLDGKSNWVEATINSFGLDTTWKVVLKNGNKKVEVYATGDHEWVVEEKQERVKTTDLRVNMRIPHRTRSVDSDKLALVHGLVYGDGSKTKDGGYVLHVCAEHEQSYLIMDEFELPYSNTERGRLYYIFGKSIQCDYKRLPDKGVNDAYIAGFIRGLFLADGCLTKQPEYIITGTEELYSWLKSNGPMGGFYVTGKSKLQDTTNFGERTRATYNIRFDLRSVDQRDCLKGFYDYTCSTGWRVDSITMADVAEVYCPSVPTTQSFVLSNGALMGNCFVMEKVPDSMEGIMRVAREAALTMQLGGGVGYDFSGIRPKGARIKSLGSTASGPVSFMNIFDALCGTISSAGHRRGAQMGCLRVDHPDIMEFVTSKTNHDKLTNFNISVLVSDEFMSAVQYDSNFELRFEGTVYDTVRARNLWDAILRATWDWAEPGVIFIDRVNQMNNLYYIEDISATNPCGEQPLPPYGACLLGSFNWVQYIRHSKFDFDQLQHDIPNVVRMMDNVIDETIYPLPEQEREAKHKRRMGLGHTGVANALSFLGHSYGEPSYLEMQDTIMEFIANNVYRSSIALSIEKGPFPLFDADMYPRSKFLSNLDSDIPDLIRANGIRNSHLLSIAPTGTISLTANNISSGIEPVFSHSYERTIQGVDGPQVETVEDYAYREWHIKGKTADQVTVQEHVDVLTHAQKWVDSSVSKTCNVGGNVSWDEFKEVYMKAYIGGAKGCTTFRPDGKRFGILKASSNEDVVDEEVSSDEATIEGAACYIDQETGVRTCDA